VKRWPQLTPKEAHLPLNLPEAWELREERGGTYAEPEDQGETGDDAEPTDTLDRLAAHDLIERLVDGQIMRTASGRLLQRAVAGARDLAHPMTPANVRLLSPRPAET
jgi:hypothetical protein